MTDADTVKCLSAKEIKQLVKPVFAANPEKYYPVTTFKNLGFNRRQCPISNEWYWTYKDSKKTCGDSNVEGEYSFIGKGYGDGKKITYAEAW